MELQAKRATTKMPWLWLLIVAAGTEALSGCGLSTNERIDVDAKVFSKRVVAPFATGMIGSVYCNQAFKEHGSKESWIAACGESGYYLGSNFANKINEVFESNRIFQKSIWIDPDGQQVTMMPTETFIQRGQPCRLYRSTVELDGLLEIMTGEACRGVDGVWRTND